MTAADFDFLASEAGHLLVEENLHADPTRLALRLRNPALATQVKFLQKARIKLPSFFEKRAILPPLAFEQCSSELAAATKNLSGKNCLDLTCGLGVDSLHFSAHFQSVTAIERDPILAAVARHNFRLFGVQNVQVLTDSAENFIQNWSDEPFDLVYLDPARRGNRGQKLVLPEDCEPDFVEILPRLRQIGRQIFVKMSPLFDVDAAARQFPEAAEIGVLSIQNEVKEVWLRFGQEPVSSPEMVVKCLRNGQFQEFRKPVLADFSAKPSPVFKSNFILEPDVAFYKMRMPGLFFNRYFPGLPGKMTGHDGFFLSETIAENCPARQFRLLETHEFHPKKLSAHLKKKGIGRLNVVVRGFPLTAAEVRRSLNLNEGGELFLLLTVFEEKKMAWLAERI